MANYNLSARVKNKNNFASERNNKLYNYIAAAAPVREQAAEPAKAEVKEPKADLLTRILATGGDLLGNVVTGAVKGVEGIVDFGIGAVGAVGGLFDEDFRDGAQKAVEYDATQEWLGRHIDKLTEQSFTNDGEIGQIVEGVASGVGQMLPSVAITLITGGLGASTAVAQGAGLAAMGVGAAGSGTEEAYKDGADYYEGLGYGTVSGATEVVTEKLFGGLTKGLTGKGILDFGEEVAEQGIKRVVKGAAEEGAEEVISHTVNPLAKSIYKGKAALKEYADPEFYKEGGKAFLTGAGTGMVYGGTIGKAINRAKGSNDDIGAAVEANDNIQKKLIRAQDNGTLTAEDEQAAEAARRENLKSIEKVLQNTDEQTRARYIKSYGLSDSFDDSGNIRAESASKDNGQAEVAEALNSRYYSVDLRGKEQSIREDLSELSKGGEQISVFDGELSEVAEKNFTKMKKALTAINEHKGEHVSFVIVNENSSFNGAERRGDRIYISADTLERDASASYLDEASAAGNYAGTLMHEYGHTIEGTAEKARLDSFLAEDEELYNEAMVRVLGSEYGITREELEAIQLKDAAGIELTAEETQKMQTFVSELGATMNEYYLGNERVIRKLVLENEPLVERMLARIESFKKTLAGKGEKYSAAEKARIDKALKLYLKAAEASGKTRLAGRIRAMLKEEEDTTAENEHLSTLSAENPQKESLTNINQENMHVSGGEVKYSKKVADNGEKFVIIDKASIENLDNYPGDSLAAKVRSYLKQFRGTVLPLGSTDKAFMRREAEGEYTNSAKKVDEVTYKDKLTAAAEFENLLESATFLRHENDNGRHPDAVRGWNYYNIYYVIPSEEALKAYSGEIQIKLISRGDCFYDITKIKDITDGTAGQALIKAAGSVSDISNNSITDSTEKVNSETKFSYKAPADSAVYKRIAKWEKLKVYERADAEKMLYTLMIDVMPISAEESVILTLENRKDAEKMLWSELNKALTDKEMKDAAEKVADFLISRSVVKTWLEDPYEIDKIYAAETALSNLKPYLHNINLSRLKGEIKHKFDTDASGVMLMWGTKKTGFGVDQIASELNDEIKGYGFPIDPNANEADIFFAIHDAYTTARSELNSLYEKYRDRALGAEERAKLKKQITEHILSTYKDKGRPSELANATRIFKAELWKADQRVEFMKQYSVLVAKVDAFKNLSMGKFVNANTYHPDLFTGSIEQLKKIVRGGAISVKATRDAVGKLAQWYRPDNPIVGEANYDSSISEKMAYIADRGLSKHTGKNIDVRELLEPYMHRIDLSGMKEQLKDIYAEETRSVLATWNLKKGMEPVSMREIADMLNKEGIEIYGDDFEMFWHMETLYRDNVGPFTATDLKNLSDIVAYFTKFVKGFNKVWNGKKYVEAEPIAMKHIQTIRDNKRIKLPQIDKLIFGRYGNTFFRPETLARRMDLYEDGFFTETLREFRQGLIRANDYEYEMMKAVAEFDKKHKNYFVDLAKRRIEYRGNKIPADIALSLYMTSKRQQAQAGLAVSGFKYNDGSETVDVKGYMPHKISRGVELGAENMQKQLWSEFSREDKEFIGIAEELFNGMCKKLKHDTDMSTKGYSNTVDGYYYPIKRAFVAKSVDSDFEDLMGRASNKSFNKDTVIGAKGVLCIMPLTEVLGRHVRGVAQYASLATVVRNYDTLYNYDIGENANDPTSIARESEKVWKEGGDYYRKLLADMQGIGEKQSALLSVIRGSYATYQLGGNPKTWVTQLSSFFASTSVLKYDSVMKGIGIDGSDVDEYCVLAKLRNANNEAVLAQANANKSGLLKKQTKLEKTSRKISDALMSPIGKVDRFVISKLFGACQVEIESKGGAKIGTKENKIEAGRLLEEVIIHTQQNSLATERSAAMRSGDLLKSFTMFSADGMNVIGQVIDSIGEVTTLKARLKSARTDAEREGYQKRLTESNKKASAAVSSLVTSAAFMAAISLLFNYLYHRIDEEDDAGDIAGDVAANFVGNLMGGLPVLRDVYSYLSDGYEVQNYMYSVLNDTLEAVAAARDLATSAFTDTFDSHKAAQGARKVIYAGGQLLGIPIRNLYNVTYSILGFIPSAKYGIDNMFYEQAYTADLKKAIEAGDEGAVATITGIMTGERVGSIQNDKVRKELNDLTLKGYGVLPRAIADSVTVGEEKIELTGKQKKQFKAIYSIANDSVTELMALKQYEKAEEKIRAKAVKLIYDIYYQLALDDVVGGAEASKNVLFAEAIDIEKLAIIVATARSIEADKNKNGISISGSKKKKIEKYIQSLNLTAVQKYMIMGYLGYKNTNGMTSVRSYIGKLNLTQEEKTQLLRYSGYN